MGIKTSVIHFKIVFMYTLCAYDIKAHFMRGHYFILKKE